MNFKKRYVAFSLKDLPSQFVYIFSVNGIFDALAPDFPPFLIFPPNDGGYVLR